MSVTLIACYALIAGAVLRLAAAIIDNDVLGILRLTYSPHALAARILCAIEFLVSLPALLILAGWVLVWAIRKMATG